MTAIIAGGLSDTSKIEVVQLDVGLLRQDLDKNHSRITVAERCVGDVEDTMTDHEASIWNLQTKVRALEYRAEDAENRSRRTNLRIVGTRRGWRAAIQQSSWKICYDPCCQRPSSLHTFTVERAHRVLPRPEGAPARTFILLLLTFRDRDELLRAARMAGDIP